LGLLGSTGGTAPEDDSGLLGSTGGTVGCCAASSPEPSKPRSQLMNESITAETFILTPFPQSLVRPHKTDL
jgi:hypothetical protein